MMQNNDMEERLHKIEEQLKKIVGENLPQLDANISNYTKIPKSSPNAYQFSKDYFNKLIFYY